MEKAERRDPITVLALITAVCLIGDSMLYVALPTHWQEAGFTSLWEVGAILSVNRFVRLPLNPVVGWLYRRMSAKRGILLAAVLAAVTTLSYGFVGTFWAWILVRCVWGMAWTFLRLGGYFMIIERSAKENRGQCLGRYNGLFRLGSFVGMLSGGFLADLFGLRNTAIIFSCITCLAIPAVFVSMGESDKTMVTENAKEEDRVAALWKNTDVLWLLSLALCTAMVYQGMFISMLSYFVAIHNSAGVSVLGWAIGAASLAGMLQALRWGWEPWAAPWIGRKTDGKYGPYPALMASMAAGALLFSLIPQDMPILLWVAVLLGVQVTATVLTTAVDVIAADTAVASSKITVMSLYSLFIDFGAAIGPLLGYWLNARFSPYAACWGAAALLLLLVTKSFSKFYRQARPA